MFWDLITHFKLTSVQKATLHLKPFEGIFPQALEVAQCLMVMLMWNYQWYAPKVICHQEPWKATGNANLCNVSVRPLWRVSCAGPISQTRGDILCTNPKGSSAIEKVFQVSRSPLKSSMIIIATRASLPPTSCSLQLTLRSMTLYLWWCCAVCKVFHHSNAGGEGVYSWIVYP